MKEDKSIEAAVLNTLYVDLVRGIREQRSLERKRPQQPEKLREYEVRRMGGRRGGRSGGGGNLTSPL